MMRINSDLWALLLIVACAALAGCGPAAEPLDVSASDGGTESAPDPAVSDAAVSDSAVSDSEASGSSVELASWDEVQQWVDSQQGKVVVVDVWSTSCLTCMKEFPHFVELHAAYPEKVACASLSVDFYGGAGKAPEDVRPQVERFLESQQATMKNFISTDPDSAVLTEIDTVAIPAALVFDREGQLQEVFNNDDSKFGDEGFTYQDDIRPLVERLLEG